VLEVQKPTQALTSVKGPGNKFDLNHNRARPLSLGIFHEIFIEPLPPPLHKKNQILKLIYLTPCCELEVQKPTQALKSV
jgi:hypothetical protein